MIYIMVRKVFLIILKS